MLGRAYNAIAGYLILAFGLGLFAAMCLSWSLLAILLARLLPEPQGRASGRRVIAKGFRLYLEVLARTGAFRFDLSELDQLAGASPLIIAPNHPSLLDAVMILSRLPDLGCVMKAELMDNMLFGSAARLARFIRNDASHGMIKQSIRELGRGSHLLLFPEGTRTTRMPVNRFKGSVALIAKKSGVPVQTVIIETNSRFLGKDWPLFRRPAFPLRYRARLGRCFLPSGSVREFSNELEHYFADALRPIAVRQPDGLPCRPIADTYTERDECAFPDSPGTAAQL